MKKSILLFFIYIPCLFSMEQNDIASSSDRAGSSSHTNSLSDPTDSRLANDSPTRRSLEAIERGQVSIKRSPSIDLILAHAAEHHEQTVQRIPSEEFKEFMAQQAEKWRAEHPETFVALRRESTERRARQQALEKEKENRTKAVLAAANEVLEGDTRAHKRGSWAASMSKAHQVPSLAIPQHSEVSSESTPISTETYINQLVLKSMDAYAKKKEDDVIAEQKKKRNAWIYGIVGAIITNGCTFLITALPLIPAFLGAGSNGNNNGNDYNCSYPSATPSPSFAPNSTFTGTPPF